MSRIEELKAEAAALREAEKANGNLLKHCDALELVAKKHGFANWRACLAMLGDEPAKPPVSTAPVPPTIIPSVLQNGEFETARASACTRWMASELRQATVDFSRNIGLVPIYAETSRDGTRYLMWHMPAGAKCEVRSGRTKEQFLEFDRLGHEQGRRLLSLHTSVDQLYSAVWITTEHHVTALEYLSRFGISPGEVKRG
jgi:hypothetical protein